MRIDMDTCEEILVTITRNKTRSLLTAFGVFWGIFMLVALIGGGQGMQEQMKAQFEGFATNSGFIAAQKTSEAYKGFRKGRWWDLEMEDVERVRSIDGIKRPLLHLPYGDRQPFTEKTNTNAASKVYTPNMSR